MFDNIASETILPNNWRNFIAVGQQKRSLVNFLSSYFLSLAVKFFTGNRCLFVTAGGFDDDNKDKAMCAVDNSVVEYVLASGNHEEADTRVWLHAAVTSSEKVIIYSPDTDVFL